MAEFKLDTSGRVPVAYPYLGHDWTWEVLTPFQQGYVEAMFASARFVVVECSICDWDAEIARPLANWPKLSCPNCGGITDEVFGSLCSKGFSDIAPETLARIIADCKAYQRPEITYTADEGRGFWEWRQMGEGVDYEYAFPPLTPYLGDDGKVYLREAPQ